LAGCAFALLVVAAGAPHARGDVVETSSEAYISLSGFVYNDINNSGTYDYGEDKIRDVLITLSMMIDGSYSELDTKPTEPTTGRYEFTGLLPGTYSLTEETPYMFVEGVAQAASEISSLRFGGEAGTLPDGTKDPNRFVQIVVPHCIEGDDYDIEGSGGYNFGEWGLKTKYLSKRSLIVVVPEPSTAALMAAVFFLGLCWCRRR
jgi:hypothetical protein